MPTLALAKLEFVLEYNWYTYGLECFFAITLHKGWGEGRGMLTFEDALTFVILL